MCVSGRITLTVMSDRSTPQRGPSSARFLKVSVLFTVCDAGFTTLTYLRVHAQKHHGQEWKESGGVRGPFGGAGGMLLCQLCGVQCKTATQLQGHMGTHAQQGDPTPNQTSEKPVDTTSVAGTVSRPNTVGLLVTDCSSIAAQPHS
ncbi:hypothetical protein GOODEAATRI_005184 [Goodea atripinnis]|uniref:C2H2-type domain-containing protein n=1 Tax=Goodea atripinnis TaxID=208336 RepID=A0ABV0MFA6_9TELE